MNAIKQGIITATTKETLLKLEGEKESLVINISKERIERPIISKEQIKCFIYHFRLTNLDEEEQKRQVIDVFLNSVHVYNDKMLIILNYKYGEICTTFEEINEMFRQKENLDNKELKVPNDYQGSPSDSFGGR